MILLVPISYFFKRPKSEVWQLDTVSGRKTLHYSLPQSQWPVPGKGITTLITLNKTQWLACDFNSVMLLSTNGDVLSRYFDEQNNDLHHLTIGGDKIYLANSGRDCIDELDINLNLMARHDGLDQQTLQQRLSGEYQTAGDYYDKADSNLPFCQRKVPDTWHFNHVLKLPAAWGGHLLATSFSKKTLVSVPTMTIVSNPVEHFPHDGTLWNNRLWITTVAGKLYSAKPELPFRFSLVFDLFAVSPYKGWCRGLLFADDKVYIGITAIYQLNSRTAWLDVALEYTRSGIYQICTKRWQIDCFYDFTAADGARIFSFTAENSNV